MPGPIPQENGSPSAGRAVGDQATPVPRRHRIAGRWYYVVLIATVGTFAWVPFLHAAIRVKSAKARRLAWIFGALDAVLYVLLTLTPTDSQGQATTSPVSTIGGLLALGTVIVGCIMAGPLRRMVYEGVPVDTEPTVDPAIRAALDARTRREEARKLVTDDPLLARELRIGRPELPRTYDNGGLVDLNGAPAHVITEVCDIPADVAAAIVLARETRGEPFSNVDELFVVVDLPVSMWDRIRDHAVLVP